MYTVYLAGGIASGKSTVARMLEGMGAWRIDLDALSRRVLEPGTACLSEVCEAFGEDLVGPDGCLDRGLLALRAFGSPESAALLESIELPYIREALAHALSCETCGVQTAPDVCVVEVPLLDRMEPMLDLADEVVAVCCPVGLRRIRAIGRGMTGEDFDRRVANQPTDDYLRAHATTVLENGGGEEELRQAVRAWWDERASAGWGER